jgi:hypothetical protein
MSRTPTVLSTGCGEQPDEITVAAIARSEEPPVVEGEVLWLGLVGVCGPCRGKRTRRLAWIEAERGQPSGFERRHDERVVRGVHVQTAWREQPRIREVGVRCENRLHAWQHGSHIGRHQLAAVRRQALIEVHVRPGPQLGSRRKDARVVNRDERLRPPGDVLCVGEFVLFQDDERDPRQELEALRRRGRVAPREILVVEVDGREVVRLEVGDPLTRLGAHDRKRVDASDVARAVKLNVLQNRLHERRSAADGAPVSWSST